MIVLENEQLKRRMEEAGVTPKMLYDLQTKRRMTLKEIHHTILNKYGIDMLVHEISAQIRVYRIEEADRIKEELKKKYEPEPQATQAPRTVDEHVKYMFMTGTTLRAHCQNNHLNQTREDTLRKRLKQLKWVAAHQRKRGEEWIPDQNFIEVIERIENTGNMRIYRTHIEPYIERGYCKNGAIDTMKLTVFDSNDDLMVFVLSNCHLKYDQDYDEKVWERARKNYEAKLDKYIEQIHTIEQQNQQRKQQIETEKKHENKQNEDNER